MQSRIRPVNYFLVFACAICFTLYAFGTSVIGRFLSKNPENHSWKWFVFAMQVFISIYALFAFIFLFKCARLRSLGYNSAVWNQFQIKFYGASAIIFLILGGIATALQMDKFFYIGAFLLAAAFISFILFLVIWRREQNIQTFVERVLHANSMSNSYVTEQNARDLFKLRECDKDFEILTKSCRLSNERMTLSGICHSEYYQLQRWLRSLGEVLAGKAESEMLTEIHKEMTKRSDIFGLDAGHRHRYQQLAAFSHLVMPIELDENDKQMNRDSSFYMHGKPDTTV